MNATGIAVMPVTAYAVVMAPATTRNGAAALIMKKMIDGTPSLLLASASEMLL